MKLTIILYNLLIFIFKTSGYLTNPQLNHICNILKHNDDSLSTKLIKHDVRNILFYHSKPFAYKKFTKFCESSRMANKMTYKKKNMLLMYGYTGLWKATLNYNGRSNFYNYASIYIDSDLKKGLTDIISSSIMPHRFRVNKDFLKNNTELYKKSFVKPLSFIENRNILVSQRENYEYNMDEVKDIVNDMSGTDRLYFNYRYDIINKRIRNSNRKVAALMCVSEEAARKNLQRITKLVSEKLIKPQ